MEREWGFGSVEPQGIKKRQRSALEGDEINISKRSTEDILELMEQDQSMYSSINNFDKYENYFRDDRSVNKLRKATEILKKTMSSFDKNNPDYAPDYYDLDISENNGMLLLRASGGGWETTETVTGEIGNLNIDYDYEPVFGPYFEVKLNIKVREDQEDSEEDE